MESSTNNNWVSIIEYSHRNNVSISTLRRKIKQNKIKFTSLRGKYYIYDESFIKIEGKDQDKLYLFENEIQHLKGKIKEYLQEINDLKMLNQIYEEKLKKS